MWAGKWSCWHGLYLVYLGGFELFPLRYLPADGGGTCRLREQAFRRFLASYTDSLNQSYTAEVKTDPERMQQEIKEIYRQVPSMYGLALPQDYQHPKQVWFNPLYSGVGVLGYMGPFLRSRN